MTELSVADLIEREEGSPLVLAIGWALSGQDYAARAELLEVMMDWCYRELTSNRHLYHELGEDQLTAIVINQLRAMSVEASHDTQVGGHCDILVRAKNNFLWIAEAKVSNGPAYIFDGFVQLTTRYAVAQAGQDRAEIIVYCSNQNALAALRRWREFVCECDLGVAVEEDATERSLLWFRTVHDCKVSGLPIRVRHSIVPLYFVPKR